MCGAPMRHGSKTMMTLRRVHASFSRLVLVALVAVTVMGGTLVFGALHADTVAARPSSEFCARYAAEVDRYLSLSWESLNEGNVRSSIALLNTAQAYWETAADAGCYGSAV
jgi:hypothetical protein